MSYTTQDNFFDTLMLTKIFFNTPPVITPAVTAAFAHLGGLDLDNPETGYREHTGYALKAPRVLSHEDVMAITEAVAKLHNVTVEQPADIGDFVQVLQAVRLVTEKIGGNPSGYSEGEQDFDPETATTDNLVCGLLTLSSEGNNLENFEYASA